MNLQQQKTNYGQQREHVFGTVGCGFKFAMKNNFFLLPGAEDGGGYSSLPRFLDFQL